MSRKLKRLLIGIGIFILIFFIAGIIIGNIFVTLALEPGSDKSSVFEAPHNSMDIEDDILLAAREETREKGEAWLAEQQKVDMLDQSYDGIRLHATRIDNPQETSRWAILCHGYMGNGLQMANQARKFSEMGFNVLLPDARSLGKSDGNYIGMGWNDRLDVLKWIQTIVSEDPAAEIVLYGVSMGGATVMMVSGEELPPNVKAIVEDCGYSSVWGEFSYQLDELFGLPTFPIMNFSSLVSRVRAGYWLGEGSAVDQVAKSVTPMLFIHGSDDSFVPSSMLDEVYEAANVPKEKILVEGAGHGQAATVLGEAYWEQVEDFISVYLD